MREKRKNDSVPRCSVHILEVPEVSLGGWQSGKGGENVFQNQLSMLLISRENLRKSTPTVITHESKHRDKRLNLQL